MNVLDLFSGIGGFSLGLERAGFRTSAFCEIEPYCQSVLRKHWPNIPIHDDIRTFEPETGSADVVCGGYPCQPFSLAGKRAGEKDERHLWSEMLRIIRAVRPRWVICENVAAHVGRGFDTVADDLEQEGFAVWPFLIPACAIGSPQRRERLWIVAHTKGITKRTGLREDEPTKERRGRPRYGGCEDRGWPTEPSMGRVAYGVPKRVDRLRALGNAIVPQIAQMIGDAIMMTEAA
jgi:DNA (cytosine-5)-methyltransferase 1